MMRDVVTLIRREEIPMMMLLSRGTSSISIQSEERNLWMRNFKKNRASWAMRAKSCTLEIEKLASSILVKS